MPNISLGLNIFTSQLLSVSDGYGIGGFDPAVVYDYTSTAGAYGAGYFRKNGTEVAHDDLLTHTASSNGTVTDSDGIIKFRAHNFITYSDDLTNAEWYKGDVTNVGNTLTAAATTNTHWTYNAGPSREGTTFTSRVNVTRGTHDFIGVCSFSASEKFVSVVFDLSDATVGENDVGTSEGVLNSASIVAEDDGTFTLTVVASGFPNTQGNDGTLISLAGAKTGNAFTNIGLSTWAAVGTETVTVNNTAMYRSDLGGMINNPTTGNDYVPTTSAAVYLPRVGHHVYNGTSWVNEGLLLENAARTNLKVYSNDFTNAQWTKSNVTIAQNVVGPDGVSNSATTMTSSSTGAHGVSSLGNFNLSSGQDYTLSTYAKLGGSNVVGLLILNTTAGAGVIHKFDLSTGAELTPETIGAGQAVVGTSIIDVGGGFYRISSCITASSSTSFNIYIYTLQNDGTRNYTAVSESAIIYGAQLEAGSTPSSYMPTLILAQSTRTAETLVIAAVDMPTYTSAISFQIDGAMTYADIDLSAEVNFIYWYLNASNYIQIKMDTSSTKTGQIDFLQRSLGANSDLPGLSSSYSAGVNVPFNIASRHGDTYNNGAVDGTALTANLTPTSLPDLSANYCQVGLTFMGTTGRMRVWVDDIGDTGIATAST